jgi:hypothetical protein
MIARLVMSLVVAVIVSLVLVYLLGPILVGLVIPIAVVVGEFLVRFGFILGILAGLAYFFSGQTWPMNRGA